MVFFSKTVICLPDSSATLLLVDDNEDERFMAEYAFQQAGLPNPMVMLEGGAELLPYLEKSLAERRLPGLLLLDINMPGVDGFACLERVRGHETIGEQLPIMMLTNSNDRDDMRKAADLGADGYQVKPTGLDDYVVFFGALTA